MSNALIQAYLFWIKDVGFDAVRVDAASSIYKNFLSDFEKALGVATFGEVFNGNVDFVSDFQKYEWGVLDFPLFFAARDVFAKDVGFTRIKEILDQDNKYVNPQNLITFIDNHDRDRFLCVADDSYEKLRMALALSLLFAEFQMYTMVQNRTCMEMVRFWKPQVLQTLTIAK